MKKLFCILTMCMLFVFSTFAAENVAFLSYNNGNNDFDGLSEKTPKKNLAKIDEDGALSIVKDGGTIVVFEKMFIGGDYTLKANGPITFTAVYGGVDYKNTSPDTNPTSGMFKFVSGADITVASDLIIDDIILFQEGAQNTFYVKSGATLTVTDKVICMSKQPFFTKIYVEEGGTAIVNGGIFSSVSGSGKIVIGEKATILESTSDKSAVFDENLPAVAFIDYNNGNNSNLVPTAETPKKGFGQLNENGAVSVLKNGGTLVACGKVLIGGDYVLPALGSTLVITSVFDDVDYKNTEPKNNPSCALKMAAKASFTISSDVVFDNIILFQENEQNTVRIRSGATLTVTDSVVFMSNHDYHFKVVLDSGSTAILSEAAQKVFTIENNGGKVVTYSKAEPQKTALKLTINQKTAYVNGTAQTLDAAPVIKNSSTMLPVRFVAQNLGAAIGWDGATSTATLTTPTVTIVITIGKSTATVNGIEKELVAPAFIDGASGRSYLPVRFIAENLGAAVSWDGATSTATLVK